MEKSKIKFLVTVAIVILLVSCEEKVAQRNLNMSSPEAVGMSSERLDRLTQSMQKEVDEENTAGITTMIARHGKIVHFETYGYQDIESNIPIEENTIFRIYSMSKPITGVALMMLYEEGKFKSQTNNGAHRELVIEGVYVKFSTRSVYIFIRQPDVSSFKEKGSFHNF